MAYTALEKMRETNRERFGKDIGPMQPPVSEGGETGMDLKSAALRFLRERCEGLRFDKRKEAREAKTGKYLGASLRPNQIPYNMEMDLNRRCLEKTLETFIVSGTAQNAYPVYYCWMNIFFGEYGRSKRMVELLSEYEENGSALLLKHRDHYSHSVYVFALGLAIYETNEKYREIFCRFYRLQRKTEAERANFFLEFWGLTALFHDIGYPFELPFEQLLSYFEVSDQERGKSCVYLTYPALENLTTLSDPALNHFKKLYEKELEGKEAFQTGGDLLAWDIWRKMGEFYSFPAEYLKNIVRDKPREPERFNYFMDHAVFSAARLYIELTATKGVEKLKKEHIDALSAILLHNSLFKFSIAFYKDESLRKDPLPAALHPLAWMLMLCDELQCWDRVAYGRNSRTELHPMAADFDFSDGAISAVYYYDEEEQDKIDAYFAKRQAWEDAPAPKGKEPRLKAYSDMTVGTDGKERFTADIEKIVDTSVCPLSVVTKIRKADRRVKHTYLSDSSFLHLYDFAVALHGRDLKGSSPEEREALFRSLSLEYQLSTISRARYFGRYLNSIGCFYTDRPVDYDMVTEFTPEQAAVFAPMEHERWIWEHRAMGWRFGREYETLPLPEDTPDAKNARGDLREQLRVNKLMMDGELSEELVRAHWLSLPEEYQDKDWKPFNTLLKLLKQRDGLRIYRLHSEE